MADTTALTKGITIKKDSKLWFVTDVFFVSPGKGSAFYRTKLKEVSTGKVVEHTYKSGEGIELVQTERRNVSFLYKEGDNYIVMDDENYEQYNLSEAQLDTNMADFLKPETRLVLFVAEGEIIIANFQKTKLPFKVAEAPPGIRGDTANSTSRAVTLETGAEIQAPLFIKEGDTIIVNVETREYCERGKDSDK